MGSTRGSVQDAALGNLQKNEGKRAVQLRKALADLGPAFVKVGQALSARPDLLPQSYLEVRTLRAFELQQSLRSDQLLH